MGADPIVELLRESGFSIGVIGSTQDSDENLRRAHLASERNNHLDCRAAVIDEHFLTSSMRLAQRYLKVLLPFLIMEAELSVAVMTHRMLLAVFFPQQLASDAFAPEFLMNQCEIRQDFWLCWAERRI